MQVKQHIAFLGRFYYNNLLTKLSHGRTRGAPGLCLANKLEEKMTVNFENLPREKQRVEIIRERARRVWLETKYSDPIANWNTAEQQLCNSDPEFRCAREVYKFLSRWTKTAIETIQDSQPLSRYITEEAEYYLLLSAVMKNTQEEELHTNGIRLSTSIGELIDILVAKGA